MLLILDITVSLCTCICQISKIEKIVFVQNLLDNNCQIGNKILGAAELLCSQLAKNTDNLEILIPPISDVAYAALMEQVSLI
jgi:hypothetical protein